MLSDQCVHIIKLAVFEGSWKSVFRDRAELSGSLLKQLEDAYAYIDRYNRIRAEFEGLDRIDRRDYPADALREALLNAIVHRDYSVSVSTLISIFDDRIEFVTIGGLIRGISYDDIMLGVSALRNRHLANVFYRLKLIEAYGTGLLKIRRMLDRAFEKFPSLAGLVMHSDQGWQYRNDYYRSQLAERGIRQSMSRKGNCYDNCIMETFFGRMKNEMYYGYEKEYSSFLAFSDAVKSYMDYYNNERIQKKTKWMPPVKYREASICVA